MGNIIEGGGDAKNATDDPSGFLTSNLWYMVNGGMMLGLLVLGYRVIGQRIVGTGTNLVNSVSSTAQDATGSISDSEVF